jgi:hypothetical protein
MPILRSCGLSNLVTILHGFGALSCFLSCPFAKKRWQFANDTLGQLTLAQKL